MSHSTRNEKLEETQVLTGSDLGERLMVQLATLAPDGDLEDAIWSLVSSFVEGSDDLCVGVCVPDVAGEQVVVRHAPRPSQPRITDAARLFPEVDHEIVVSVPFDEGTTLRVGCDSPIGESLRRAADQLALAVGSTVRRHRLVAGLAREAEEARAMREQAVQSDKLAGLGRMAANIVHELNNPLTSIVAYADLLRRKWEEQAADPSDRERLARISEAAGRVLAFTRDLVAYSRPSTATPSLLSIHDVIERAVLFCEHVLSDSNVTVVRSYGELPPVHGLHGPLTQVFVNLITNACQAMAPRGGRLSIVTEHVGGRIVVRVVDEGTGIAADALDRLFEPYFTTRGEGGGNGLGLNIVQTILASHGGSVTAANAAPARDGESGRGATFTVDLPVRPG